MKVWVLKIFLKSLSCILVLKFLIYFNKFIKIWFIMIKYGIQLNSKIKISHISLSNTGLNRQMLTFIYCKLMNSAVNLDKLF